MRNGNQIFDILGIEPTSDKRLIKKAYAQKVKECHPEESPEEWQQLHEAYEAALKYAKGGRGAYYVPVNTFVEQAQEQREQEQREWNDESVRKEDELKNLFQEIDAQNVEKKLQLKEEYSQEIAKLENCSRVTAFWRWKAFFSHSDFLCYIRENEFWKMLAEVLERLSLNGLIINYILRKLDGLEEYVAANTNPEITGKFWQVKNICKEKKKYLTLFGAKIRKQKFINIAAIIIFIVMPWGIIWQMEQSDKINVKEELVEYLDEKYGAGIYQSEDFYITEIEISSIYDGKDKSHAYCAKVKGDNEKEVCIWSYKEKGIKKPEVLCFDNFQQKEIEADLQEELVKAIGAGQGMVYLSAAEPDYVQVRYRGQEAVYNTLYEGNLEQFFEKESAVRREWMGKDNSNNFDVLGNLRQRNNINGRCAFWFPDKEVADIQQRLENPQCSYNENFCQAIKAIEQNYGIQVLAAALPQSYYEALEQELEKGEYDEKKIMKRAGLEQAEEAPAEIPFVTMWYMAEEPDITSMMETTSYESMLPPEVMQQVEEATGVEEVQETECEELHTIEAQKLEDGIYLMDAQEDGGFHRQRSVKHKENEISITCSNEYPSYMLILDMEKLGIKEDNYYVQYQHGEEAVNKCNEYSYVNVANRANNVWQGEGFLFIGCNPSQRIGTSTYTVVLEAYQEE